MSKINLLILGCCLILCEALIGQERSNLTTDTIPFFLTSHNNIAVNGILNDTDTIVLMFHTAANDLSLTTKSIENLKSIKWDGEIGNVKSWGGETDQKFSRGNSLQISGLEWDSITIWEVQRSGHSTDGKFGPDLFGEKNIEIDFNLNIIVLHERIPSKAKTFEKIPIEYSSGKMFIELTSKIGDRSISNSYLIHSGYSGGILFDDKFATDNNIADYIEITDTQKLTDSFGNVLKTKKGKLPECKVGNKEIQNIPVGFFEGVIGRQKISVIGCELLKRFNLIIDSKRENIYIKLNGLNK